MNAGNINGSGDGTRPTTDGGVDNIGAASSFTPGQPGGGDEGPVGKEKMSEVRKDKASLARDDSAPLGLKQPPDDEPNTDASPPTPP